MGDEGPYEGPLGYTFAVADNPFCCWDFDHEQRTLDFLNGLDGDYFGTLAAMLVEHLRSSDVGIAASIALRAAYQQGIEALMSLLGALAQAPHAVPAWVAKCTTRDLIDVKRLADGHALLTQDGRCRLTFGDLSAQVHRYAWVSESGDESTAAQFGRFWRRLASEMLNEVARAEYNAIKHGLRVSAGGFHLAIGSEDVPGVPAPPEAMTPLGGSQFGSTFFVPEEVGTTSWHIRMRRTSVNWSPEALGKRLALVSMSISNAAAALRCHLGADPASEAFHRPVPLTAFDEVWAVGPTVRHTSVDTIVRISPEDEVSRAELKASLDARRRHRDA